MASQTRTMSHNPLQRRRLSAVSHIPPVSRNKHTTNASLSPVTFLYLTSRHSVFRHITVPLYLASHRSVSLHVTFVTSLCLPRPDGHPDVLPGRRDERDELLTALVRQQLQLGGRQQLSQHLCHQVLVCTANRRGRVGQMLRDSVKLEELMGCVA